MNAAKKTMNKILAALPLIPPALLIACSVDSSNPTPGAGGTTAAGGVSSGLGGMGGAGGAGGIGVGGTPGFGGAGMGGIMAIGGAAPLGGSAGMGGAGAGGSAGNAGGMGGAGIGGSGGDAGGLGGTSGASGNGGSGPITCPSSGLSPGDSTESIMVGGNNREYVVHVPNAYDGSEPVPLLLDFHPLGGSGPQWRSGSPYPGEVDSEGVITVYPSGRSGPSGGAWNVGPCCVANTDDVEFAKALVARMKEEACIDPNRVYAAGFSMGGGMSHYLACHAADVFAAVAPAAFDLLEENEADCEPARAISVVFFRGTNDGLVPYDGGYSAVVQGMPITFLGAAGTLDKWGQINECQGSPTDLGDNCEGWESCKDGVTVRLCTQQGGGHMAGNPDIAWPIIKEQTLP